MKRIFVILALILVCAGAAIGGLTIALGPERLMNTVLGGDTPPEAHGDAAHGGDAGGHGAPEAAGGHGLESAEPGAASGIRIAAMSEMIVNITSLTMTGRKTTRFLKLNIAFAIDQSIEGAERFDERRLFIRDTLQDYLRQLAEDDLEGSAGLARLKAELLRRARAVMDSEAPREVLVSDMVIQ
ncbi:flagellar basal body-associated FliL family protein [Litorisediminicola beolgyonensis]|uniref:Flagellar protein FliL n=1 Tax=Litorisediminicola beolgyonensis TaxID=1173614 RepID=A0ABW3ZH53_9RHOB